MPGLTSSLLIATGALQAQQGAINAAANNIANMNTDGYSRQEAILVEGTPMNEGGLSFGSGVVLNGIKSVRNELLELRLQQETQNEGYTEAKASTLSQVNTLFSSTTSGIGAMLSAFLSSLQTLSTSASLPTARNSVLTAANNLATAFNTTAQKLDTITKNLNLQVTEDANKVNVLTAQIADLNRQVQDARNAGMDSGTLEDQRTELTKKLSELIDLNVVQTEQGPTLTTAGGISLVVGSKSFALSVQDNGGSNDVYAQGQKITNLLHGGQLGGVLDVRDSFIPALSSSINQLATDFKTAFNAAHNNGYDLSGAHPTTDFFSASSALDFKVLITDPNKIAASSSSDPTNTGSNGNVASLISAADNLGAAGSTYSATAYYSKIVFNVGNETAQAKSENSTAELSLNQLQDQRNAVSGVSLDEETSNLLRYQHAYQAAARVVSTVDELIKVVLNMGA